ncbi:transcriptional regulator [Shewanella sp. NFH-SH190041]|uniref:ArsR/SmtB family transcription factor n=1 Tax=Shewanella sp. NFH-SH190041 TaxID=2950245 RepID=UPI0021C44544|nr:metalloregulator ArsR/SmtB family transcription factor [Shewanella sp. NFH-SH190041]BDM62563.1 transcriptional regulator [Shewanella sp. NFH-SH190041]
MEKKIDTGEMVTNAQQATEWLKAMANPYRLIVLCQLLEQELSVTQLNATVPLSQSALSQHLAILRKQELVACRKSSQNIYYRLNNDGVRDVISIMYRQFCV